MRRFMRIAFATLVRLTIVMALWGSAVGAPGKPAHAGEAVERGSFPLSPSYPLACEEGTQSSGAIYRICMPDFSPWNGDLIVYAHGYVDPHQPVRIPEEQLRLPDGTSIPFVANALGYAFATTSYSINGLAVREALVELVDLVTIFKVGRPTLNRVYLIGASEGGLITTLAVEQFPTTFSGGLATCGPVGDFGAQINYVGDFRVVFDYFFPGLMPGTPISIPQSLIDNWSTHYSTNILPVILDPMNAITVTQLLSVTQAAYDVGNPTTSISNTIHTVLWYNVFATNDAIAKLGGQPFDNESRAYTGSANDDALNAGVQRFIADLPALREVQAHYQTSGQLRVPLVTLHTTLDEIVPYWHEPLYRDKVVARGRAVRHDNTSVARYGHCNFTTAEVTQALALLQARVANPPPIDVDLSPGDSQQARPGSTVVYTHTLTNTGSLSGTFVIEAASSEHWPVELLGITYPTGTWRLPLLLEPGMTTTLQVSLTVPAGVAEGIVDHTVVTATSQISPSVFMAVSDITTVKITRYMFIPVVLKNHQVTIKQ